MNYFDLYSSYPDPIIATAWDSQIKEAEKTSWLADKVAARESELFAVAREVEPEDLIGFEVCQSFDSPLSRAQ